MRAKKKIDWFCNLLQRWNANLVEKMTRHLVEMIVDYEEEEDTGMTEDDSDDDAPAGACTFSKADLSALSSVFLNSILDLFSMMEAIGGFLATSTNRSATINYRMAMDEYMIHSFWHERGCCKQPEAANVLLCALKPRHALRMIGFAIAEKFTKTYDAKYLQKFNPARVKQVEPLFDAMSTLSHRSRDVDEFYEIDLDAVLASFLIDPSRLGKIFRKADHIAVLLACIASCVIRLHMDGEDLPVQNKDLKVVKQMIQECIDTLKEHDLSAHSHKLGCFGHICLSQAEAFSDLIGNCGA